MNRLILFMQDLYSITCRIPALRSMESYACYGQAEPHISCFIFIPAKPVALIPVFTPIDGMKCKGGLICGLNCGQHWMARLPISTNFGCKSGGSYSIRKCRKPNS